MWRDEEKNVSISPLCIFSQSAFQLESLHEYSFVGTSKNLQLIISETETLMDFISSFVNFPVNNNFPIITIKIFQNSPEISQGEILQKFFSATL